jgi:hypothetical protein
MTVFMFTITSFDTFLPLTQCPKSIVFPGATFTSTGLAEAINVKTLHPAKPGRELDH